MLKCFGHIVQSSIAACMVVVVLHSAMSRMVTNNRMLLLLLLMYMLSLLSVNITELDRTQFVAANMYTTWKKHITPVYDEDQHHTCQAT